MSDTTTPQDFIENIVPGEGGFWCVVEASDVSYPDDGHDCCHAVEAASFWFAHRNKTLETVVRRFPPPEDLPFVDVGGGNGFVAQMISRLGHRVVLIEPGESGAAHARDRGLAEIVRASIVDLDVKPGSVGGIGLFDVLEHIEDDAAALERLRGMLSDNGRLYITVPAHEWLWSSVDAQAGHYRRYTLKRLERLLEASGFDVTFRSYYFSPLPLPILLLRCLPEKLGLRKAETRSERANREHDQSGGILEWALGYERRRFARGLAMPAGASCVVVATRRDGESRRPERATLDP